MKTGRFCPHCGRPLLKSQIKGYTFQCFACEEDFCKFEVLRKKDLVQVREIQKQTIMSEQRKGIYCHSVKKPYPRYYIIR